MNRTEGAGCALFGRLQTLCVNILANYKLSCEERSGHQRVYVTREMQWIQIKAF